MAKPRTLKYQSKSGYDVAVLYYPIDGLFYVTEQMDLGDIEARIAVPALVVAKFPPLTADLARVSRRLLAMVKP